ncbi:MAG: transcription antitermination factor NusB [Bacteroidota bacterium]
MKAIYAFKQTERSDYDLAIDFIVESFKPDLNSMKPQNLVQLKGLEKLAIIEFEEHFQEKNEISDVEVPIEAREAARKAINLYNEKCKIEKNKLSKNVVDEVENLYSKYIQILLLVSHLAEIAKNDEENRLLKNDLINYGKLSTNEIVVAINESKELDLQRIKHNADWKTDHLLIIRQFYKDVLRVDKTFKEYCIKTTQSLTEDAEIIAYIYKNLVFRGALLKEYFEERDINWTENSSVLRSLVLKTIDVTSPKIEIQKLAYNWEDDKKFFIDLFKKSMENDELFEKEILAKVKNWEDDRVALLDLIIMKMALTELVYFPSIPIKVTINEYIDLAKSYSTPQSGKFVNGILDYFAIEWAATGKIKKSGRGLIDNK